MAAFYGPEFTNDAPRGSNPIKSYASPTMRRKLSARYGTKRSDTPDPLGPPSIGMRINQTQGKSETNELTRVEEDGATISWIGWRNFCWESGNCNGSFLSRGIGVIQRYLEGAGLVRQAEQAKLSPPTDSLAHSNLS